MIVKKAFTLIELLLALFLASILLYFGFSYQFNFLKEIKYLEDQEYLVRETFVLTEYVEKGVMVDDAYIPGFITITGLSGTNYKTRFTNKRVYLTASLDGDLKFYMDDEKTDKRYIDNNIEFNSLNINKVKDMNNKKNKGLYSFKINTSYNSFDYGTIDTPHINEYTRLIYTK